MKAKFDRSFERGRELVRYLMLCTIVSAVAALLLTEMGSIPQAVLIVLSFVLLIAMITVAYRMCRCPYCGKHIIAGALTLKCCPACNRDLSTGKKVKKSRR